VSQEVDQAALEQFMGQLIGTMTGGMMCFSILLGDELGLYRLLAEAGPTTAEELAGKAGCNGRLVQEWLDGQAANAIVIHHADGRYELRPEAVWPLADETSPVFVARGMNVLASVYSDLPKIADAFRGSGPCRGASTTPACSRARNGFSGRATGPTCLRSGSRPSTAWRRSWPPGPGWRTSAAATAPRRS
jgi:hypothetical protein